MSLTERLHQACYGNWVARQLSRPIEDPFEFAYKATERELGKRNGWPAIHAATMGFFAGIAADTLAQFVLLDVQLLQGSWIGSGPALAVGALSYIAHVLLERTRGKRLDYHAIAALECNEGIAKAERSRDGIP